MSNTRGTYRSVSVEECERDGTTTSDYKVRNKIEKLIDVMYLHCRAFEDHEAENWPALNSYYEQLNEHLRVNAAGNLTSHRSWKLEHKRRPSQDNIDELDVFLDQNIQHLHALPPEYREYPQAMDGRCILKDHHLSTLQKVWKSFTLAQLQSMIGHLGPKKVEKLLSSLCIRLRSDCTGREFKWFREALSPVKMAQGSYHEGPLLEIPQSWSSESFLSDLGVFYSGLNFLFDDTDHGIALLRLSQSISNSGGTASHQYATPFGQAITDRIWDLAFPYFMFGRGFDITFQALLSWYVAPISHSLRTPSPCPECLEWPNRWLLCCIGFLGLRGLVTTILDIMVACKFNIAVDFRKGLQSPLLVLNLLLEGFSACFACKMAIDYWTPARITYSLIDDGVNSTKSTHEIEGLWPGTYLKKHPAHVFSLIWLKWLQLLMLAVNSDVILPYLLPAWAAISSLRSLVFLTYLFLLSIGTMLAYYALPVALSPGFLGYFTALYRMFSLDLLGQFDDNEMEGVNLMVDEHSGEIVSPPANTEFHMAIRVATIGIAFLFPVILLNMYVGILSTEHDQYMERAVHAAGVYRSRSTLQLMLGRSFWRMLGCRIDDRVHKCLSWTGRIPSNNKDPDGVFILIPSDLLAEHEKSQRSNCEVDRFDKLEVRLGNMVDEMKHIKDQLDRLENLLERRVGSENQ